MLTGKEWDKWDTTLLETDLAPENRPSLEETNIPTTHSQELLLLVFMLPKFLGNLIKFPALNRSGQDTAGGLGHPTAKRASSCRGESGKVLRKAL